MASTFTDLGLELMATGENAGTWGTKTNANLNLIEQLTGGVNSQAVTDSGTPTGFNYCKWCFNRYCSTQNYRTYWNDIWKQSCYFSITYRNFLHY